MKVGDRVVFLESLHPSLHGKRGTIIEFTTPDRSPFAGTIIVQRDEWEDTQSTGRTYATEADLRVVDVIERLAQVTE
jgi:hypothetical protein